MEVAESRRDSEERAVHWPQRLKPRHVIPISGGRRGRATPADAGRPPVAWQPPRSLRAQRSFQGGGAPEAPTGTSCFLEICKSPKWGGSGEVRGRSLREARRSCKVCTEVRNRGEERRERMAGGNGGRGAWKGQGGAGKGEPED